MATTLTVINSTPHSAVFELESTDSTPAYFKKSGASGNAEKDLTSLNAGPLKAFLNRLADWAAAVPGSRTSPSVNTRIRWRYNYAGDSMALPVLNTTEAMGAVVAQGATTAFIFVPVGASTTIIEMTFVPSAIR